MTTKSYADCYADVIALTSVSPGTSNITRRAHHGKATVHMTQSKGYRLEVQGEESVFSHFPHEAAAGLFWQTTRLGATDERRRRRCCDGTRILRRGITPRTRGLMPRTVQVAVQSLLEQA